MNSTTPRFLFLVRHPPLAGARIRETLDRIFTVAAFDQWVTVLFLDDGVFHLVSPGAIEAAEPPAWFSMLQAMELYDIQNILVEEDSLRVRGLGMADLAVGADSIPADRVRTLLAEHDRLVVC